MRNFTLLFCVCTFLLFTSEVWASRTNSKHQDLFAENSILFGAKAGGQVVGYTTLEIAGVNVSAQSSVRPLFGLAAEFVYDLPRFEFDLFWNMRGSELGNETYHSVCLPFIAKIPWMVAAPFELEFGLGYQSDFVFAGPELHRTYMSSLLFSLGTLVDFDETIFSFEARYGLGLQNVSEKYSGGKTREIQFLAGLLWMF